MRPVIRWDSVSRYATIRASGYPDLQFFISKISSYAVGFSNQLSLIRRCLEVFSQCFGGITCNRLHDFHKSLNDTKKT